MDDTGKSVNIESHCRKLTEKGAYRLIDSGAAVGFIWYNENAEITKIVFWGSTITQ